MAYAAITWGVTITASNKYIDINESGGGGAGVVAAQIATGTYTDIRNASGTAGSLAAAIKTALEAAGAGTYTITPQADGTITIAGTINFAILFSTGANEASSARYVLGFGAVDSAAAATHTGTDQQHGLFLFASGGPDLADDTEDRAHRLSPQSQALDGSVAKRPIGSTRYEREIQIAMVPRAKMFADTNEDQSIESMFDFMQAGNSRTIELYDDASVVGTSTEYAVQNTDGDTDNIAGWRRHSPGVELWSGSLTLLKVP